MILREGKRSLYPKNDELFAERLCKNHKHTHPSTSRISFLVLMTQCSRSSPPPSEPLVDFHNVTVYTAQEAAKTGINANS